jgi:hypothetical protein
MLVFTTYVFKIPRIFINKFQTHTEKLKRQIDMWIMSFVCSCFCDTIYIGFVFFVSMCVFQIGSENSSDCKPTSCEH